MKTTRIDHPDKDSIEFRIVLDDTDMRDQIGNTIRLFELLDRNARLGEQVHSVELEATSAIVPDAAVYAMFAFLGFLLGLVIT